MTDRLVLRNGAQRRYPGLVVGLFGVLVGDGRTTVELAIGTPETRHRVRLAIGGSCDLPGVGRLTLRDVRLDADPDRSMALFELTPADGEA